MSIEIGSGSFKKVYRGYDEETGTEIAWNVISIATLPKGKFNLIFSG